MTDALTIIQESFPGRVRLPGWRNLVISVSAAGAAVILFATAALMTPRETERAIRAAGEQAQIHAAALGLEIGKAVPVPRLAARDPLLAAALAAWHGTHGDLRDPAAPGNASVEERLGMVAADTGLGALALLDRYGAALGIAGPLASERVTLDFLPLLGQAMAEGSAATVIPRPDRPAPRILFAAAVGTDGALVAEIRPAALADAGGGRGHVVVTDAAGTVLSSTLPGVAGADGRALWENGQRAPGANGGAVTIARGDYLHASRPVGALGLRLHFLAPADVVGERVRAIIGAEIIAMTLLAAFALFMDSRRTLRAYTELQEDADELRRLNARLSSEIAERRRVEAELRAAEDGLAQASKLAALGQMAAAVGHELNQPLAAMKTSLAGARLLVERGERAEATGSLAEIDALIGRMASITRQLKGFARKGREELQRVDMCQAARGAAALIAAQVSAAGVRLDLDLGDGPAVVLGDQLRIEQILVNLLRNALDAVAGAPVRTVTLSVRAGAERVEATVSDTGPGLPPGTEGRLFEPFFTTKKSGEGLGLGLAISAGIAEDLGGTLRAAPRPGGGARFTLGLPPAPVPPAAGKPGPARRGSGGGA